MKLTKRERLARVRVQNGLPPLPADFGKGTCSICDRLVGVFFPAKDGFAVPVRHNNPATKDVCMGYVHREEATITW